MKLDEISRLEIHTTRRARVTSRAQAAAEVDGTKTGREPGLHPSLRRYRHHQPCSVRVEISAPVEMQQEETS